MQTQSANLAVVLPLLCLLMLTHSISVFPFASAAAGKLSDSVNPFTPKASLIRYWNSHVSSPNPILTPPPFLLSKASPLSAADSALLSRLASLGSLPEHHRWFCSLANMFCSFDNDELPSASSHDPGDADFTVYSNRFFSTYGTSRLRGSDSFKNYSDGLNTLSFSFKKYTKDGSGHSEAFTSYGSDGNVANGSFANYGFGANGGTGDFKSYGPHVNVPNLLFTTYGSGGNNHKLAFGSYSDDTNTGFQDFVSYAKHGNSLPSEFINYGGNSNTMSSTFTGYDLIGNAGNESFVNYGGSGNDPRSNFKTYGALGNAITASFSNYRDGANEGTNSFQSYARNGNSAKTTFTNYGKSFNPGNDTFKEYGKGSRGNTTFRFKSYGIDRSFKDYADKGVTFAGYSNTSSMESDISPSAGGSSPNRWVEPGRFFRESMLKRGNSMLKRGNSMMMPDLRDKMPGRPFLPRSISSKLPFSSADISMIRDIFHAREGSTTDHVILAALHECERQPSRGETKRCAGSAEDMIDFVTSVLGRSVFLRTTESVNGSTQEVMIGEIQGINGGAVTESVSCHQSLYPYLLYYCHSVPKVRVYEADILDHTDGNRINRGVAVCHVDTSAWGPGHGAFVALGHGPGEIEVCHWIFENDMTWTIAD